LPSEEGFLMGIWRESTHKDRWLPTVCGLYVGQDIKYPLDCDGGEVGRARSQPRGGSGLRHFRPLCRLPPHVLVLVTSPPHPALRVSPLMRIFVANHVPPPSAARWLVRDVVRERGDLRRPHADG
ncbi:MAG: hypothetical protein ACPIOQ_43650, partial [Promethearchaeia archaeon]